MLPWGVVGGGGACLACHQLVLCFHCHLSASAVRADLEHEFLGREQQFLVTLEEPGVLRFLPGISVALLRGRVLSENSLELE